MRITPMLRQYFDAKEKHPDSLLFFRMGDFYELFFEDAQVASNVLDITLTSRNKGDPEEIPMAGVPHHAADGYIQRLVTAGHKVAICEQVEDPAKAKGIVRRDVVRVITPGVRIELDPADSSQSNFLAAVHPVAKGDALGVAMCDISTGEIRVTEVSSIQSMFHELSRASARELLVPDSIAERVKGSPDCNLHLSVVPKSTFALSNLRRQLRDLQADFPAPEYRAAILSSAQVDELVGAIEGLGLRNQKSVDAALAGLLHYIARVQLGIPAHVSHPQVIVPADYAALDSATEANLEIFSALIGGGRAGSLLSIMDKTVTAVGARLLRNVLAYPLTDVQAIRTRHEAVGRLATGETRRSKLRDLLKHVADIPRLTGRVVGGRCNARDLLALATSLQQTPAIVGLGEADDPSLITDTLGRIDPCDALVEKLSAALVDEPPATTTEGGMIRKGFDADLDEILVLSRNGKDWLLAYEKEQRQEVGIDNMKLKYNRVFGYYLEVTKANLHKVPEHYIRKQTLASAERYFTPELKEYEDRILNAEDRRKKMESEIFADLVSSVVASADSLRRTAAALAQLDLLCAFAELAVRNDYVRPEMNDGSLIDIEDGRHPVVEKTAAAERFIPNSVRLDTKTDQLLIVTGPNMAGKSTIIRQVAIISLMAQTGSFVPAKSATLGVVDQIFSRVGASDNLAQGQSTFMVEMTQTAHILKHATERSLIILDEIGRGTSTFDGLAIAWAVAEFICDTIGAKTMFATHYHELTEIVRTRERAKNVSVAVKEWNDDIVFLRRLVDGPANQSYGIQVGRLAGLPQSVVGRAKQVLANLESDAYGSGGIPTLSRDPSKPVPDSGQLDLFCAPAQSPSEGRALTALRDASVESMTPIEALNLINALKQELESS